MSTRAVAWALAAVDVALIVAYHSLDLMNGHRFAPPVVGTLVGLAFITVGTLIALRRPENPIGWIYLAAMALIAFGGTGNLADQYAVYALATRPGELPVADWVLWAGELLTATGFLILVFSSLLLFPDGRPASKGWRPVLLAAAGATMLVAAQVALIQGPLRSPIGVLDNPVRLPAEVDPLLQLLLLSSALSIPVLLVSVASPFLRFRAASGVERQQLKWFAYAAAWVPIIGVGAVIVTLLAPGAADAVGQTVWPLSVAGIPLATAVAVLRYRLYDIDVLIRRTLIYAAVSLTLAATYFAGVVLLQTALRPLIGGSEVPVALSTLAVVGLFAPLRRRIQGAVDRRFYRSRYDAARTLDAFGARLRDEVDLEAVRGDLLEAVHQTVRPAHASVWLRGTRV